MILTISGKEAERRHRAELHDAEMQEKYGELNGMSAAYDDYHYWYEEREDKPGAYRHYYPLPYSRTYYLRRFAELFFSPNAEESIVPTLAHEFLGDETDADYITDTLLISAEKLGFFTPGAMIAFYGGVVEFSGPPIQGSFRLRPLKGGYREAYEGSKANKERAKVIRKWLKRRATELAAPPSNTPSTILAPNAPQPELPTAPPSLLSSADLILGAGFTLNDADQLARAVRLIDETGNYHLGPRKFGALVGFALALQQAGKLTGAIPALTAVLGPRWGVNVATRKTTTGIAEKYFKLTNKALTQT